MPPTPARRAVAKEDFGNSRSPASGEAGLFLRLLALFSHFVCTVFALTLYCLRKRGEAFARHTKRNKEERIMKKLAASLALLVYLASSAALAADSGKPALADTVQHKEGRVDHKGNKKPRPRFEDCDKDADGALNAEEFLACYPHGGQERFAAIDADKSGKVSRDELRAFREARRAEKRRELFTRCDANKDGVLSLEEFEQCEMGHKSRHGGKARAGKAPAM